MGNSANYSYNTESQADNWICESSRDWMKRLRNSSKISEVSIPGTHDTCARYGGDAAECQCKTLEVQLEIGIRFVDIRCRMIDDCFAIHHGRFYQKMNFNDVLKICQSFLRNHPSEFILMRVKKEYDVENCRKKNYEILQEYISSYDQSLFYLKSKIPNVGEVRGKIVIMTEEMGDPFGIWYHGNNPNISISENSPQNHIESFRRSDKTRLYFTCFAQEGLPYLYANFKNDIALKLAQEGPTGVVMFDFPGNELIQAVIKANF